jgi:hypothetical protein
VLSEDAHRFREIAGKLGIEASVVTRELWIIEVHLAEPDVRVPIRPPRARIQPLPDGFEGGGGFRFSK